MHSTKVRGLLELALLQDFSHHGATNYKRFASERNQVAIARHNAIHAQSTTDLHMRLLMPSLAMHGQQIARLQPAMKAWLSLLLADGQRRAGPHRQ